MLNLLGLIATYIFLLVVQGIGYAVIIGAAPGIAFIALSLRSDAIEVASLPVFAGISLLLWLGGYLLIVVTGEFAGIFMLLFILMMIAALIMHFFFTIIMMALCVLVGEAFFSHLWVM